jgi:hypothetical protein
VVSLNELLPKDTLPTPETGYALAAPVYLKLGYTPIPLIGKVTPSNGLTGGSATITPERIKGLREQFPFANTGIKHDLTCTIDIDDYDEKTGNSELLELESRLGKLPDAPYTTSRGAGNASRQMWFRRESNDPMNGDPTANIEVIWSGYRCTMVAPSVHPETGEQVAWYDPKTHEEIAPPSREDLPDLPPAWEVFLSRDTLTHIATEPYGGEIGEWERWLDDSDPTHYASMFLENLSDVKHVGHSDLLKLLREINSLRSDLWEKGVRRCLEALRSRYLETTNERDPQREWSNAAKWVIGSHWSPDPLPKSTAREIALRLCSEVE